MGAPGAGKTILLVRMIRDLKSEIAINVVEGNQETALGAAHSGDRLSSGAGQHRGRLSSRRGMLPRDERHSIAVAQLKQSRGSLLRRRTAM
ncbi:MAG: hypothetical protein ACREFQ_22085 [Stellaceae bacterium]